MRILFLGRSLPSLAEFKRTVEKEGGYLVFSQDELDKFSPQALEKEYQAIVLDLEFFGKGGLELLEFWRQNGLKTSVITLVNSSKDVVKCLDSGADDSLCKPFAPAELLARLRANVRRNNQEDDLVMRILDLEINAGTQSVRRGGFPISLTRREFAVLKFLAAHNGRIVSRAMIWQHLEGDLDYTSNVVDVYISYLRKKIDKAFKPPLIRTCWGKGYMLQGVR